MLLDRIDIDEHGSLNRVELGPFGEQLNVVFAPIGSGKTAIARFMRDTLVDRQYPTGMLSSSTGRVVWATRSGMVHCYREQDGTRQGRQRVHFEPRGEQEPLYASAQSYWLDSIATSNAMHRSLEAIELPESIVDGVITDTAVTNVARVVASCLRHGLDRSETYRSLPLVESALESIDVDRRESLRAELASVEAELSRIGDVNWDYTSLMSRRNALNAQLAGWYRADQSSTAHRVPEHHRSESRLHSSYEQLHRHSSELNARARQLRSRQSDLRNWIAELESQVATRRSVGDNGVDLHDQLVRSRRRLADVTAELDACLENAADLRRSTRWVDGRSYWMDRDAVVAELRRIDDHLATASRCDWLLSRRRRLRQELGEHTVVATASVPQSTTAGPLAALASRWLARVSGGRLNRVDWVLQHGVRGDAKPTRRVQVSINGRPETGYASPDRALAALAVRLAAGELLARTGRHIPLVVETQREMWQTQQHLNHTEAAPYFQLGDHDRYNHPLVAALRDYASGGRQLLVLTSDRQLMMELSRTGARSFEIHPHRIIHGHQPLWRPRYERESYVGPHPHVYGHRDVETVIPSHSLHEDFVGAEAVGVQPPHPYRSDVDRVENINRDLDMASQVASGFESSPYSPASRSTRAYPVDRGATDTHEATDWAAADVAYRDGYYYADTYTTVGLPAAKAESCCHCGSTQSKTSVKLTKPRSPFLLSVDSPIDQAPSIDAVAAARLRGLNVTHITHLMQQDANRLADALGLASVDAATVRRWQAESRLCCRVPQLRNFDARILVGCGITTPAQLAAIHPMDLLDDVEAFLATEEGQRILRSGSSQELARITTWIAAANSGVEGALTLNGEVVRRGHRESGAESARRSRTRRGGVRSRQENDRDGYDADSSHRRHAYGATASGDNANRSDRQRSTTESTNGRSSRDGSRRRRRTARVELSRSRGETSRRQTASERERAADQREQRSRRESRSRHEQESRSEVVQYDTADPRGPWRFYLERQSPVEDAPSVGPRMAERLARVGIDTVDDLLKADPETLAAELGHRRVDAETIAQWQQQAALVCRVPMLRGHDAQLLVAAKVTSPEELASCDANELVVLIDSVSRSSLGKRILRGGQRPDLAEVTDWIEFAQHHRELKAA
jgi:hypothetical protein